MPKRQEEKDYQFVRDDTRNSPRDEFERSNLADSDEPTRPEMTWEEDVPFASKFG
jgi:hypothetical protein